MINPLIKYVGIVYKDRHMDSLDYEPISNKYNGSSYTDPSQSYGNCQSPSLFNLNKLFFNIKNSNYEVVVMWFLLITTIVIILSLVVSDAEDRAETERAL